MVARYIGAKQEEKVREIVHTAMLLALVLGTLGCAVFLTIAPHILNWIDVPENIRAQALLYIRIIFCGLPAVMTYNYAASMVRASGDSRHPLLFLTVSGITNVLLNLILVIFFGLGVDGVAIATVASQYLSAVQMVVFLLRQKGLLRLSPRRLRFHGRAMCDILHIGLPVAVQNTLFNFANVLVQSSVNAFGDLVIAGKTAAGNLMNFVYVAMGAVNQATVTFVGQNIGARRKDNVKRILRCCVCMTVLAASVGALLLITLRGFFVGLYIDNEMAAQYAYLALLLTMPFYPLAALLEVFTSALQSMGKSFVGMCISLFGACATRIAWIKIVAGIFFPTVEMVFFALPASFIAGVAVAIPVFLYHYRRVMRQMSAPLA